MGYDARHHTAAVIAAAMLVGCGGAGTVATTRQGVTVQDTTHHATGSNRQFLYLGEYKYVGSNQVTQTLILSYPSGHKVGKIRNYGPMCTDSSGNVYIEAGGAISEYAPGSTSIIAQASSPSGVWGTGCAYDPTTGNVAVCGARAVTSNYAIGWVGVYPNLNDAPTVYTNSKVRFDYCGYDDTGNLFLDGFCFCSVGFSELLSSNDQVVDFNNTQFLFGPVQWDGQYITVEEPRKARHQYGDLIWRLAVSGSSVSIVGTTHVVARGGDYAQYTWIDGMVVVKPYGPSQMNDEVGYWHYPEGGTRPFKILKGFEYVEYPLVSTSYATTLGPSRTRK